jgi:chromosome segregation ATPase
MIVSIAQDIQKKIARQNELTNIRDNQKNIEDTHKELKQVKKSLREFVTLYQVLHERLDVARKASIIVKAAKIQEKINFLHKQFASKPRQVKELRDLKSQIKQLTQQVEAAWKLYANEQVKPHFDLLKLVKQLPEIARQADAIHRLQDQLRVAINKPPNSGDALKQFDRNHQALKGHLANLSDLDPNVRTFLNKALQGQATIADLSLEILAWCRQEGRAQAFKISFK